MLVVWAESEGWWLGWAGVPLPQPCPTLYHSGAPAFRRQDTIPAFPASDQPLGHRPSQ